MPVNSDPVDAGARGAARGERRWYRTLTRLAFIIFCFEIGVFLVVFPWLDVWESNRIAAYSGWLAEAWGSPYLRGALSGLGLVNIGISFLEILRLIRGNP